MSQGCCGTRTTHPLTHSSHPPTSTHLPIQIAAALRAEKLILMTDVPGVLRDKDDASTKYPALTIRRCKELQDEGIIAGGMIPKVRPGV